MDIRKALAAARILALGLAMLFAGCTAAAPAIPELVPVAGTVTYHGQPVPGAIVAFHPVEVSDYAEAAFAETDSQGHFNLEMHDYGSGALPGDHVVTVMRVAGGIPEKYKAKDSSTLRATVEDTEKNEIPLVLED